MKRHPYLIPFSRFHRSILFLALIAKENAPKVKGYPEKIEDKISYALEFYEEQLLPHFNSERNKVFTVFTGKDSALDELIVSIEEERQIICEGFEELKNDESNFTQFHDLGEKLEKHVRREERELFQMIQAKCEGILSAQET